MKNFSFMRVEKVKSLAEATNKLKHNYRSVAVDRADLSREHLNYYYSSFKESYKKLRNSINSLVKKPRKNAVYAAEFVFDISTDRQKKMTASEQKKYFDDCFRWAIKKFGKENFLGAAIHHDEGQDIKSHGHIMFLPIKDGSLNCSAFLGGSSHNMSLMQDDFHKAVGLKHGLDRGVKGRGAKHSELREHEKLVNDELPRLRDEKKELELDISSQKQKISDLESEIELCIKDLELVNKYALPALEKRLRARYGYEMLGCGTLKRANVVVDEYDKVVDLPEFSAPKLSSVRRKR